MWQAVLQHALGHDRVGDHGLARVGHRYGLGCVDSGVDLCALGAQRHLLAGREVLLRLCEQLLGGARRQSELLGCGCQLLICERDICLGLLSEIVGEILLNGQLSCVTC